MGSFNETCALSNLNIPAGCPVRLLFLTQNPYIKSDQQEAQRGCYHYDNWFLRSPPLKGKYDDYGRAKLSRSPLIKLVADLFQKDVVERPFGFNQYHSPPVVRGKNLDHYLAAAWEGRLLVQDEYRKSREKTPEGWPTWEGILAQFKKAKLPIQTAEDKAGYNAQAVIPGVVCVDFNSYGDIAKELAAVEKILSPIYDCRIVKKFEDRDGDQCLMVTVKGGFDNPSLLAETEKIKYACSTHPEHAAHNRDRQLPVLAVMVREDVWQTFANITIPINGWDRDRKLDKDSLYTHMTKSYDELVSANEALAKGEDRFNVLKDFQVLGESRFRDTLHTLPFQVSLATHMNYAVENKFTHKEELIQACAEAAHVEIVMARLNRPWYIPPLGGQDGEWELHTELLSQLHAISKKQHQKEIDENEDDE